MTTILTVTVLAALHCTQYYCTGDVVSTQVGSVITYTVNPSNIN